MATEQSEQDPETIEIEYRKVDQHRRFVATSVRGGLQPRGDFKIDLMYEYQDEPHVEIRELDEGRLSERVNGPELKIIREIEATVVLPQEQILTISSWMLANAFNMDQSVVRQTILENLDVEDEESSDTSGEETDNVDNP